MLLDSEKKLGNDLSSFETKKPHTEHVEEIKKSAENWVPSPVQEEGEVASGVNPPIHTGEIKNIVSTEEPEEDHSKILEQREQHQDTLLEILNGHGVSDDEASDVMSAIIK